MSDITLGEPTAWFNRDTYTFLYTNGRGEALARVQYDYVHEDKDTIRAEVTVWWLLGMDTEDDVNQIAGPERVSLFNSRNGQGGWGSVVAACEEAIPDVDWKRGVQRTVQLAIQHFRESDETHMLVEREVDATDRLFLLAPWVSSTGVSLLYAPGGTGKSIVALGMAVSVATGMALFGAVPEKIGPVLYIDYEDDAYIHELRLGAIIDGAGWEGDTPTIHHLALTGSVRSSVKRIRKAVAEHEVVMIVLDSVGLARGADPNSAGDTIDLFKYLRDIGIPILAIDHVRKEHIEKIKGGKVDPNTVLAFGSQYSMSSARLAWFMREMRTSTPQRKRFNLHNTKYNHVQEQAARSIIMEIDSTEAGVIKTVRFAIEGTIELDTPVYAEAGRDMLLKVWSINQEAMTLSQFAQALGATKSTVQRWIEKDQADVAPWFKKLPKQGREIPYALTEVGIVRMSELSEGQNG